MKIACQTITFGKEQRNFIPEVIRKVAKAGYDGVEIGIRHITHIPPKVMKKMLDDSGLHFVAGHLGGNLEDPAQANSERSVIDAALDYLLEAGASNVIYSGKPKDNPEEYQHDFDAMNRGAKTAHSRGIRIFYHNHAFEFHNNMAVMTKILNESVPELGFCLDVGWVVKAGWPLFDFLNQAKERIRILHFKDYGPENGNLVPVELGTGIVPWKELAPWIKSNFSGEWVVAEQDSTRFTPEKSIQLNAKFCRKFAENGNK